VPFLQKALSANASSAIQMPDLRYYLGDALARSGKYAEAEPVLVEEVRLFPYNLRARAALAMLYRATGHDEASDRLVNSIVRVAPTPEGYALATKLWTMFGETRKAEETKRQPRRTPQER
jgi:Flp pilus assembly protein TadD